MLAKSDEQLVVDYLKGDEKSLEILITRYLKPIYSFVYRYVGNLQDAEDVTQDVFVKMWRHLKRFNTKKGSFKGWLFCLAKNTAIDALKKKKATLFSRFENEKGENIFADTLADSVLHPDELLEKNLIAKMLKLAMEKLSLKYQKVLLLRYNDQFTFREIAKFLGEPLNTVKSRHRRALILLKKILTEF